MNYKSYVKSQLKRNPMRAYELSSKMFDGLMRSAMAHSSQRSEHQSKRNWDQVRSWYLLRREAERRIAKLGEARIYVVVHPIRKSFVYRLMAPCKDGIISVFSSTDEDEVRRWASMYGFYVRHPNYWSREAMVMA